MTTVERAEQEVRQREENLKRYRAMVKEADEPRVEVAQREFERAKQALEEAERMLGTGRGMVRVEEEKLNAAYRDYFRAVME